MEEKDYSEEILDWKWNQIRLREKYGSTPAGFPDASSRDKILKEWYKEKAILDDYKNYRLESEFPFNEEVFVGREETVKKICEQLAMQKGPVFLYGIGGIGKSALARFYAGKYRDKYDRVVLLTYNTSIQNMICDDYNLHISNFQYSKERYENKRKYFQEKCRILSDIASKERLLFIVDDYNTSFDKDMELLIEIPGDFIFTTRMNPKLWGNYEGIHVRELQREDEWQKFIEAYRTHYFEQDELKKIYEYRQKVQGHTLKMMMEIRHPGFSDQDSEDFSQDLFYHFPLKKEEKQAICYFSIMPVQGIPKKLFLKISGITEGTVERLLDYLYIKSVWNDQWKDEMLCMHPLIAEAAREVFVPSPVNCSKLLIGFKEYIWDAWDKPYLENQRLGPYVFAMIKAFPKPAPWLATAFGKMVIMLWMQGYYTEAEEYSLKLFEAVESYYGDNHQNTGRMALWTAAVYHNSMKFKAAKLWYYRALDILQRSKPADFIYLYLLSQAYGEIAWILRHENKLEEALEMSELSIQYLEQYLERYGDYPAEIDTDKKVMYAYTLLSKGKALFLLERLDEAEVILNDAVHLLEINGVRGFRTNEFYCFLVEIFRCRKKFEQAERLAVQTVETAVKYRGETFKDTLSCKLQLADIYVELDKKEEAVKLYEEVAGVIQQEYPMQVGWLADIVCKIEQYRPNC